MSHRRTATATGPRKPAPSSLPSRSKSVLANHVSTSSTEESSKHMSPPKDRVRKQIPSNDDSTNIQVVVRCRHRSDREIQEGSPAVVLTDGARSQGITVETGSLTSVLGVITAAPSRTYPFDFVFGPEADQAMIYNDVVAPILEQVISGYNCTLFAYRQTGTGKTYTMQGDLVPSHLGNPSIKAGVIPRVLYRLFDYLENNAPDYSVKISFLELYNEELRDLLANEMTQPDGNIQPMGIGIAQPSQSGNTLKIFDDSSKRGVLVQGLEETPVKDFAHALALLNKGSQRRQIAATKFNDHSSRSHSVFSITIHLKETSSLGDDILRIGKLNLVDLAGSENIGRSGAENKRAREAGIINQSLLTLGRVINALVDKSSHIPYRESKLTRLLQDSLGGRTKTCIIATISPAKCNLEETISTLDYALRAKDIRNKPELNQRLTKNALLKEYIGEIDRLKADLLAAREKNGIILSQESWDQITTENEERRVLYDESKRQISTIQSELAAVREEFEQCMSLLRDREGELRETKTSLEGTRDMLRFKEQELIATKQDLDDEVVYRQAYQHNEGSLDNVASSLKATVETNMADIRGLFKKIDRQDNASTAVTKAISTNGRILEMELLNMEDHLHKFIESQATSNQQLLSIVHAFRTAQVKNLEEHSTMLQMQQNDLQAFVNQAGMAESTTTNIFQTLQSSMKNAIQTMNEVFDNWSQNSINQCESLCHTVQTSGLESVAALRETLEALIELLQGTLRDWQSHLREECAASTESGVICENIANSEIARLRHQNKTLKKLLKNEKDYMDRGKDTLVQKISTLFAEFAESHYGRLEKSIFDVQENIAEGESTMQEFLETHSAKSALGTKRRLDWDSSINYYETRRQRIQASSDQALHDVVQGFEQGITTVQSHFSNSLSHQTSEMKREASDLHDVCSNAFTEYRQTKRARTEAMQALEEKQTAGLASTREGLAGLSKTIEQDTSMVIKEATDMQEMFNAHHNSTLQQLSNAKDITRNMVHKGTKKLSSTGTTPTKQDRKYPQHWTLTGSREQVLKNYKENIFLANDPDGNPDTVAHESSLRPDSCNTGVKAGQSSLYQECMPTKASVNERLQSVVIHRSTGGNGFGKVTRIPSSSDGAPLKDRSTNMIPIRASRQ